VPDSVAFLVRIIYSLAWRIPTTYSTCNMQFPTPPADLRYCLLCIDISSWRFAVRVDPCYITILTCMRWRRTTQPLNFSSIFPKGTKYQVPCCHDYNRVPPALCFPHNHYTATAATHTYLPHHALTFFFSQTSPVRRYVYRPRLNRPNTPALRYDTSPGYGDALACRAVFTL